MNSRVIYFSLVVAFSLLFPFGLFIWWKKKTNAKTSCFIVGAIVFIIFAFGLEQISHYFCLFADNSIARFINSNPIAYVLYAAFAAGIFEETARLFAYKVPLRKCTSTETSVAYGIGHGGIEVILVLTITYAIYLLILLGKPIADEKTIASLLETINQIPNSSLLIACLERVFTVCVHIGLSMIVFYGIRKNNYWWYILAILLHALVDIPAAIYQKGYLSLIFVEVSICIIGVILLFCGIKLINKLDKETVIEE